MEFEEVDLLPEGVRTNERMASSDGFLSIEGEVVKWYSRYGRSVLREFSCERAPSHAIFCSFPLAGKAFCNSVVIVLARHMIRIFASGTRYDINLSFPVSDVFSSSVGLLVERTGSSGDESHSLYAITHPLMRMTKLSYPCTLWTRTLFGGDTLDELNLDRSTYKVTSGQPRVISVNNELLCVMDSEARHLYIFQIGSSGHDHDVSLSSLEHNPTTPSALCNKRSSADTKGFYSGEAGDLGSDIMQTACDLEVIGHGLVANAKSHDVAAKFRSIGSFDGNEMDSRSIMANFASAAGENSISAAAGGSHLRFATGPSNRRRHANQGARDGSGSKVTSLSGEGNVDTFYNALLGIDRKWSLQENTSSWLRQTPSNGGMALTSDTPNSDSVELSFNASSATPFSHHSKNISGLSSSCISRQIANSNVLGSAALVNDNLKLFHTCTIPLPSNMQSNDSSSVITEHGTIFDYYTSSEQKDNSFKNESLGISVAFVPSISDGGCFLDLFSRIRGELLRYALPETPKYQLHDERDSVPILASPVLHWLHGVCSFSNVRVPELLLTTILCFFSGDALLISGSEVIGPVKFGSPAGFEKLTRVKALTNITGNNFIDEVDGFNDEDAGIKESDLLICEFDSPDSICTERIYRFSKRFHWQRADIEAESAPWLYCKHDRYALGSKDILGYRLSCAAQEVLTPRLHAAVLHVLCTGNQFAWSQQEFVGVGNALLASPAIYVLIAAFSSRIGEYFVPKEGSVNFDWICRVVKFLSNRCRASDLSAVTTWGSVAFEMAISKMIETFDSSASGLFLTHDNETARLDGAAILYDALHVICEDLRLRDIWSSGKPDCSDHETTVDAFSDSMMLRQALCFIAAAGGGEDGILYLEKLEPLIIDTCQSSSFQSRCINFLCSMSTNKACRLSDRRFDFTCTENGHSLLDSMSWVCSSMKNLDTMASTSPDGTCYAPLMFPLPKRYKWRSGENNCTRALRTLELDVCSEKVLIQWCPTLNVSYRLLYFLWEAITLTSTNELSANMEHVQAWRLAYAFMSSYALDVEGRLFRERQDMMSSIMPQLISLLPRPLALAVQFAILKCATQLPHNILFCPSVGSTVAWPRSQEINVPMALLSRLASMDTLILTNRTDIALNSLSSFLYLRNRYPNIIKNVPWESTFNSSSLWSWRKIFQINASKNLMMEVDGQSDDIGTDHHASSREEIIGKRNNDLDGLQQVLISTQSRFPLDERVREACRIVDSTREATLRVVRTPDMDDAAYKAKLQTKLLNHCRKSMSSPVGRGMLTLSSMSALIAEPLHIPPLAIAGRVPPLGTLLNVETTTADMLVWPEFHNGVAAGLRVRNAPSSSGSSNAPFIQLFNDLKTKKAHNNSQEQTVAPEAISRDAPGGAMRYWVLYNRAAGASNSHAGALLAFGLLGHLKVLTVVDIADFLTTGHNPTTIAMLIGLGASHLGTSDIFISKTICLHIPSLLPSSHGDLEIEIPVLTQAAALTGLGLLNAGSGNRTMAEFLLSELIKRPRTEKGNECREVYVLSAAWALGMLAIGKGGISSKMNRERPTSFGSVAIESEPMADLRLDIRLLRCIEGGHTRGLSCDELIGATYNGQRPRSKMSHSYAMDLNANSSTVIEPYDSVNTAVTSFGAILALSLIYIKTGNDTISARLMVPETVYSLESERPDLLFARAMAQCLIQWRKIEDMCRGDPSCALCWLNDQVPTVLRDYCYDSEVSRVNAQIIASSDMSIRSASLAYLSIVTGYCMGIALVHAGTANEEVKNTICVFFSMLLRLRAGRLYKFQKQAKSTAADSKLAQNIPFFSTSFMKACNEKVSKVLVDMYLSCLSISAGIVMSGTGDISVLRLVREARMKNEESFYGSQMAYSMTTGMLFLCGGKSAFKRDPISIGILLLSVCPWFPAESSDNKSHLQATRHLYALAVEWRWLRCVDVDSGADINMDVEVHLCDDCKTKLCMSAPCLLPELASIERVCALSQDYFPGELVFQISQSGNYENIDHNSNAYRAFNAVRGVGQPMVLFLKRIRCGTNYTDTGIKQQQVKYSPWGTSFNGNDSGTQLMQRHAVHIRHLTERLSLKWKSAVYSSSDTLELREYATEADSHQTHRLNHDIRLFYLKVEEVLLASIAREPNCLGNYVNFEMLSGTIGTLGCMIKCGALFHDFSYMLVPPSNGFCATDAFVGPYEANETLKKILSFQSCEANYTTPHIVPVRNTDNLKNLASLYLGAMRAGVFTNRRMIPKLF